MIQSEEITSNIIQLIASHVYNNFLNQQLTNCNNFGSNNSIISIRENNSHIEYVWKQLTGKEWSTESNVPNVTYCITPTEASNWSTKCKEVLSCFKNTTTLLGLNKNEKYKIKVVKINYNCGFVYHLVIFFDACDENGKFNLTDHNTVFESRHEFSNNKT